MGTKKIPAELFYQIGQLSIIFDIFVHAVYHYFPVKHFRIHNIANRDSGMHAPRLDYDTTLFRLRFLPAFRNGPVPVLLRGRLQHLFKFFIRKGLYQIMESPYVKCLKDILFQCRYENQNRAFVFPPQLRRCFHSVPSIHPDIQEQNIESGAGTQQFFSRTEKRHFRLRVQLFYFTAKK